MRSSHSWNRRPQGMSDLSPSERELVIAFLEKGIARDEATLADIDATLRSIRRTLRESERVRREVMPILRARGLVR